MAEFRIKVDLTVEELETALFKLYEMGTYQQFTYGKFCSIVAPILGQILVQKENKDSG